MNKLAKLYYICLIKLLRINIIGDSITQINSNLKQFNLFSFHHRCVYRILIFTFKIKADPNSPACLKRTLDFTKTFSHPYQLRESTLRKIKLPVTKSKFGDNVFRNAFGRLLNKLNFNEADFNIDFFKIYKRQIIQKIDFFLNIFMKTFSNFSFLAFSHIFYK